MIAGSAKAMDHSENDPAPAKPSDQSPSFWNWLRTWRQVLIGELLHLLEPHRNGGR